MDFNHTEERRMLQDTLRRYFSEQYSQDARVAASQSDEGFSKTVWKTLADLGVIGMLFKESDGGYGGAGFDIAVVFEELGRAGAIEPFLQNGVLAGGLLAAKGSDAQKAVIADVIEGEAHLALAHSEPNSRYALNHVETRATKTDSAYVLSGRKCVVMNGHAADVLVISARVSGEADSEDGISLFCVPRESAGISWQTYETMDGCSASEIILENVELPLSALLGVEGEAFHAIEKNAAFGILALCAKSVGAMECAKDLTLEYLRTREQFGIPIGKFQALQHRMADMLIEIEQARSAMVNLASHMRSERGEREKYASAAKNLIGRVGKLVAEECVQMHGGIGMTDEYALAHYAKTMIMIDHQLGDVDHHLERFIRFSQG
ncbi:MAG: pimeloyl-CoA dehydrogenase small subunit [Robiginitomaculum sp.]|nr:MAG: pimeloyl-CoA dehydrogenase small subunit [Robiginitomaculum sp.]